MMKMKLCACSLIVAGLALLLASPAVAQTGTQPQATPEKYLELLRRDVRSQKVALMTDALNLTDAQGTVFWPIYREYSNEAAAIGDRRLALVKKYSDNYTKLTGEQAAEIVKDWFSIQNARLDLLKKYNARIEKATSPLIAGRFVQVEHVLDMLIDIQLAAEVPLLE